MTSDHRATDVFVSYAHIDNVPFGAQQSMWVSAFSEHLHRKLEQVLGREIALWRDARLGGSSIIWSEICRRLETTSIMTAVLSPRYAASESCLRELQCFAECQNVAVGTRKRIVKVTKTPLPLAEQPKVIWDVKGFDFFRNDPETGRPLEFESSDIRYWHVLNDLAYEIRDLLRSIAGDVAPARDTVYLAETTSDLDARRLELFRDLKDRGRRVTPEGPLPLRSTEFRAAVETALAGAKLSIHVVGGRYGPTPEAEMTSTLELQCEIANAHSIPVIVWIPPGASASDPRQSAFLKRIEEGKAAPGCEVLKTGVEELKTFVKERLDVSSIQTAGASTTGVRPHLYIVCDSPDRSAVRPIWDSAYERGFECTLPLESGSPSEIREDHEENLRMCDGVLVYWGSAGAAWARKQFRDVLKVPGMGRMKKAIEAAFYLAAPETAEKNEFRSHYFASRNFGAFDSALVEPFFERIARSEGAGR